MKLSVVIPVYNREKIIAETVHSILRQDAGLVDYEIILVDDGSQDASASVCRQLERQYPQVTFFTQENAGPGAARNNGLAHAQGDYVWFVDSDDWIAPDSFSILKPLLDNTLDAVVFSAADVLEDGQRRRWHYEHLQGRQLTGLQYIDQCIRVGFLSFTFRFSVSIPLTVFRRQYLVQQHLLMKDTMYHEDFEFMPRAFFSMQRLTVLNDMLYLVRHTPGSIVRSANVKKAFDYLTAARCLYDFVTNNPSSCNRKLYVAIAVAVSNSLFEVERSCQAHHADYLHELRHHADIYAAALWRTRHAKFMLMALLLHLSPSLLVSIYNKILIKL